MGGSLSRLRELYSEGSLSRLLRDWLCVTGLYSDGSLRRLGRRVSDRPTSAPCGDVRAASTEPGSGGSPEQQWPTPDEARFRRGRCRRRRWSSDGAGRGAVKLSIPPRRQEARRPARMTAGWLSFLSRWLRAATVRPHWKLGHARRSGDGRAASARTPAAPPSPTRLERRAAPLSAPRRAGPHKHAHNALGVGRYRRH